MSQFTDLIQSIQPSQAGGKIESTSKKKVAEQGKTSFGDTMSDFLEAVNANSKESASRVTDVVQGKSDNLAQAMISMEESKLSFQLMIEIRTKLLESYQEISRMQV